jgi:hypothetical protein
MRMTERQCASSWVHMRCVLISYRISRTYSPFCAERCPARSWTNRFTSLPYSDHPLVPLLLYSLSPPPFRTICVQARRTPTAASEVASWCQTIRSVCLPHSREDGCSVALSAGGLLADRTCTTLLSSLSYFTCAQFMIHPMSLFCSSGPHDFPRFIDRTKYLVRDNGLSAFESITT